LPGGVGFHAFVGQRWTRDVEAQLANYDARVRFETRASRGNPKRALALLDKLGRAE